MKGFIIQIDTDSWLNWQGLVTYDLKNSVLFSTEADAIIVRDSLCSTGAVLPHERNDAGYAQLGTYFELHRNT